MPDTDDDSAQESTSKTAIVASKSALGAAFLVANQIGSRALTFMINQLLFRFLSPGTYGVVAQLELFSISTLYFSRESLRVALQRQRIPDASENTSNSRNGDEKEGSQKVASSYEPSRNLQEAVNVSHVAILLGVSLTVVFSWLYLRKADPAVLRIHHIRTSLYIYALATIIELLNEPAYAMAQQQMLYGSRASAEFLGSFSRCVITCALAIWASRTGFDIAVLPFALGQLAYASTLTIVYLRKVLPLCTQNAISLLPKTISHHHNNSNYILSRFSRPLITIAATFYGQSIFKQFQTSGDGYLIATLAPLPSQGAYALATNYGGLLARVLFQPIEESSRSLFGRLLPSHPRTPKPSKPTSTDLQSLSCAKSHLTTSLHLYLLLSLLATTLGPPLSPLLLRTIAGSRWSTTDAPLVLASYCYLIPLLAINGILEAFVTAVATPAQVGVQNVWMAGFSVAFAGTGFVALRVLGMGARGLVGANAVVMGLRVWWSWGFVGGYFRRWGEGEGLRVREIVPAGGSLGWAVATRAALEVAVADQASMGVAEFGYCLSLVGFCVLGIGFCERGFLLSIIPSAILERVPVVERFAKRQRKGEEKKHQ